MKQQADLRKKIEGYSYGPNDILFQSTSSKIYKGIRDNNKETVAIKVIDVKKFKTQQEKKPLQLQIEMMLKLKEHPNIIRCFDVYITPNNYYIITEYCIGGDLQTILDQQKDKLPISQAISIFIFICKGYKALYFQGYIHRNLNLSNILLRNGECKINDFQLATKEVDTPTKITYSVDPSPYRSPESLKYQTFGPKCDIWSLGVILYVLLHNRLPFSNYDNNFSFKTQIEFDNIPINAKELIQKCLQHHSLRITFPQFQAHEFIQQINTVSPTNCITLKGDFHIQVARVTCKVEIKITPEMQKIQNQKIKRGEIAIKAQIAFMRFLFRLQDMLPECELQFLVIRHLIVILRSLKSLSSLNDPYQFPNGLLFFQSQGQKSKKIRGMIDEYSKKYSRVEEQFEYYIKKGTKNNKLVQYFNKNFVRSEGFVITIFPILVGFIQTNIKQLLNHKQLSSLEPDELLPKELQILAIRLDFSVTYYQLNCLSISNWSNLSKFAEYSRLDEIINNPPSQLSKIHIKSIQAKISELGL